MTTEEFKKRAKLIHIEDKYDYSKVEYNGYKTKVIIICDEHGDFEQTPNEHLSGCGCPFCAGNIKFTTEEFIKKAKLIHIEDKYDYSKVEYINSKTKVIIICKKHGEHYEFEQIPSSHLKGNGCPKCVGRNKTTKEFIEKAKELHGDLYDYTKVNYIDVKTKVIIICKEHDEFEQTPDSHLNKKSGCTYCAGNIKYTTEEWIEKAKEIHKDKYDYLKVNYIDAKTKVTIICNKHGEFEQNPKSHISGCGCPKCAKQYSKSQIEWLNYISIKDKIIIQHGENEGEFIIPNTRFKADGYCKETNTVYEFHGDYWHGNPLKFDQNEEFKDGITFGQLYEKTIEREKQIKDMGFNLIVMWENDWKKLNKFVKIIQRSYRKKKNIKID